MKKISLLAILLLACLLLTLYCSAAVAEIKENVVASDGQTYTIDTEAKTATLTKATHDPSNYDAQNEMITVPDTITVDGTQYAVTKIGDGALTYRLSFGYISPMNCQHLVIGKNVQSIGNNSAQYVNHYDIKSIVFKGDKCLNIAANAFSGWGFASNLSITVYGAKGCMDAAFVGTGLPETFKIKYIYDGGSAEYDWKNPIEDAIAATKALQTDINNAVNGVATTLYIENYIQYMKEPEKRNLTLTSTIRIPKNKVITLTTKEANGCSITASAVAKVGEMFYVTSGASLTFDGNIKFQGGTSTQNASSIDKKVGTGNIVTVRGHFTLKQGNLTGGKIETSTCAAVWVGDGAQFDMTGGGIHNFALPNTTLTAAVVVGPKSVFNMSGGDIYNNRSASDSRQSAGGGVLLYTWDEQSPAACMNLSGNARITTNTAGNGAGIYMTGNTNLQMSGGRIEENRATYGYGGGVCVAGENSACKRGQCIFNMTGGTISGNTAKHGGGIYANSQYVTLKGGNIIGNTASEHGGGVYVSTTPYTVHLENAVIKENRATIMGGGMWLCPTGFAKIHVTNGGAIYNNKAKPADPEQGEAAKPITDAAADDIASLGANNSGLTLADRMLGGGKIGYYKDGTVTYDGQPYYYTTGYVPNNNVRFDPANPGEPLSNKTNNTENLALISVASDGAKALAEKTAKLIISGNTAARGGGIGANGGVIIGKEDAATYPLTIKKDWGNTPDSLKQEVTLHLVVDNCKLDAVKLNANNSWTATLTGFAYEDLDPQQHKVTLVEDNAPAGFKLSVSELTYDKEKRTFVIEATNMYTPIAPDKPEIEIPKTGDSSHIGLMIAAMAASLLGLLACALAGKRRGNR